MKRFVFVLWIFLVSVVSCSGQITVTQSPPASTNGQVYEKCGDGILSPREKANPALCPQDATIQIPTAISLTPSGDVPPLYFSYIIHVHIAKSDIAPYIDDTLSLMDEKTANYMLAAIEGIAEVLDRHGLKGTWQVVYGTSKGLCTYQGQDHIFRRLADRGHEIAIHVHKQMDIQPAFENLRSACGITPITISGFLATLSKGDTGLAQQIFSEDIRTSIGLGMTVSTENLAPSDNLSPFGQVCTNQLGIGNDMWAETGNLFFPWKPDYQNGNICNHNPNGNFVLIDHISAQWMLAGQNEMPDMLEKRQFDYLQQYLDAALNYMQEYKPEQIATWGFVTHIIEYSPGGQAENPPDPAALASLDTFLNYVDTWVGKGRIIYATASEIAEAAFPEH